MQTSFGRVPTLLMGAAYVSAIGGVALRAAPDAAQSGGITTYCNPIDIEYRYNFEQLNEGISYRSGADQVIVNQGGAYYLFETIAGGWWRSTDLVHWRFVTPSM